MIRKRSPQIKKQLLYKSREAALNAVQTFNNPLTTFKTETFIVLMNIAWMYLLHAYYRREGVEYRYSKGSKRRKFDRTKSGAFKYWELERCLNDKACPLQPNSTLYFLSVCAMKLNIISLRTDSQDGISLAALSNGTFVICSVSNTPSIRRSRRSNSVILPMRPCLKKLQLRCRRMYTFMSLAKLSDEEMKSQYFRRRFLFTPMVTSKRAQSDKVIEFVPFDSNIGQEINDKYQQVLLTNDLSTYRVQSSS